MAISNRGGARLGAGRKKQDAKSRTFVIANDVGNALDNQPEKNKSKIVNNALRAYLGMEK